MRRETDERKMSKYICSFPNLLFFGSSAIFVIAFDAPSLNLSNTHQTGNDEVAYDDSSHGPPALLLTGIKEDDAPEHVEQDDGHGHEG